MVKVGNAHPTLTRLNHPAIQPYMGDLFVAVKLKHRNSSVGAACCMPVGHVFVLGNKNKQVAPTELNTLIRWKCYKQAAPTGLKWRVSH